jgi:hypothetical protein
MNRLHLCSHSWVLQNFPSHCMATFDDLRVFRDFLVERLLSIHLMSPKRQLVACSRSSKSRLGLLLKPFEVRSRLKRSLMGRLPATIDRISFRKLARLDMDEGVSADSTLVDCVIVQYDCNDK